MYSTSHSKASPLSFANVVCQRRKRKLLSEARQPAQTSGHWSHRLPGNAGWGMLLNAAPAASPGLSASAFFFPQVQ